MPFSLLFIPVSFLDSVPNICLFKNLTGRECPGCGLTHSVISLFHFDFVNAFYYNKFIIIIFPLLTYLWLKMLLSEYKKMTKSM